MLKKEIFDTIKVFGQTLLILLIIPLAMMLDWHVFHSQWDVSGIFHFAFMAILIMFAIYSGVSIFHREKKDRSLEYMFTLPVSRWKILVTKIAPRFLLLFLLIILGAVLGEVRQFWVDTLNIFLLFFFAVTISLAVESLVNAMVGTILMNAILYYGALILNYLFLEHGLLGIRTASPWLSLFIPAVLLLGTMIMAFLTVVKRFDLKPLKWQVKPYLLMVLPIVLLVMFVILLFLKQYLAWIIVIGTDLST